MSDLILNINIPESVKRGSVVLETYAGKIPHLKSRQFSGPLRKVNINGLAGADNLGQADFKLVKDFLDSSKNVQISRHQYILSNAGLYEAARFAAYGCLFYKDRNSPMFQLEEIAFKRALPPDSISLNGVQLSYDRTHMSLKVDEQSGSAAVRDISAKAYVDLDSPEHRLQLVFDYDGDPVRYEDENRNTGDGGCRDFGFEERIVSILRNHGWAHDRAGGFRYEGQSFEKDVSGLVSEGLVVLTNKNTRIVNSGFNDLHVSYGIDWFDIKGSVKAGDETYSIADLISFKGRKDNWVEVNGKTFFLPEALSSALSSKNRSGDGLKLDKTDLVTALEIANETGGRAVQNIEKLTGYESVKPELSPKIQSILRPYQLLGVKWLLSLRRNGFGGCLADDMGLGKTLQVIAYLSDRPMAGTRNLIIVPKTLLVNWCREFAKFSPETSVASYHGAARSIDDALSHKVIVTTYGTVLNDIDKFSVHEFDNLIIDEAQHIKNQSTKIYRAIRLLKARTRLILTGTPVENNINEFWGLMTLVNPAVLSKADPFRKGADNAEAMAKIKRITAPFLLRRLKKDVLTDLPEKQEQVLYCRMGEEQHELYDRMLSSIQYEIKRKNGRFEIKNNSIMLNGLLYLQEICCHPLLLNSQYNTENCSESAKFDQLLDILEELYSAGHKAVIFSRFTRMLKIMEKQLIRLHYNTFYLDGQTSDRMQVVEDFEKSENGLFLISLKAGGTGLNLVSADTAIIYDPWWNPAIEKQAEDRIYRIGQTRNVMIYRMIVEGTIEEKVQNLQKEKSRLYEEILNGHEMPLSMTADVMRDLLMN